MSTAKEAAQAIKTQALARLPPGYQHFLHKIAGLKDDPNSADFVIKSGNREFRVHSHVVALHSDASHSVLKPGFSEYEEREWDWQDKKESAGIEAESEAAAKVIDYFYRFEYDAVPDSLDIHARVYAIADCYLMPDLKLYAQDRFEAAASRLFQMSVNYPPQPYNGPFWHQFQPSYATQYANQVAPARSNYEANRTRVIAPAAPVSSAYNTKAKDIDVTAFFEVIPFIYKKSLDINPGLRKSVVRVWNSLTGYQKQALGRDHWTALLKEVPELAVDLIVGYGEEPSAKTTAFGGHSPFGPVGSQTTTDSGALNRAIDYATGGGAARRYAM